MNPCACKVETVAYVYQGETLSAPVRFACAEHAAVERRARFAREYVGRFAVAVSEAAKAASC